MGVLPTTAVSGAPGRTRSPPPAAGDEQVSSSGAVHEVAVEPTTRNTVQQAPVPLVAEWRDRELVGEYYAFIGARLKARHQRNRKLEFTVDGFRRTEWAAATERASETGRPTPPALDLSPAELRHLAAVRGYKERCSFYTTKFDQVLEAVQELAAETPPTVQAEVVAWR